MLSKLSSVFFTDPLHNLMSYDLASDSPNKTNENIIYFLSADMNYDWKTALRNKKKKKE